MKLKKIVKRFKAREILIKNNDRDCLNRCLDYLISLSAGSGWVIAGDGKYYWRAGFESGRWYGNFGVPSIKASKLWRKIKRKQRKKKQKQRGFKRLE